MAGRRFLLSAGAGTAMAVALVCSVVAGAAAATDSCSDAAAALGCEVSSSLGPGDVILELVTEGGDTTIGPGAGPDSEQESDIDMSEEQPEPVLGAGDDLCSPIDPASCLFEPALPADPAAAVPGVVVTLRDIASFVPAGPGSEMEPGGWAVEDLPANFVAVASVQVVSGMLLGQPADVRFTPVGFRWMHSDGAVVESGSPGATWAVLGQREFSVTGTSHVYAESGEYTVALEVVLRAEYRFAGSGWRSIAGTLAVAGDPQRVLVGEFDTVLTNGDCNTNPSGPGC
ncbi:hypothetical protein [Agromyces laixinhei]|uniref:hypothetical protein n=1 Tax=Agromyces laixinhei TaxID=2585717 RepID=UPI001116C304|nr:hypothetical protein [Agromyces laixinhei]